MRVFLETPVMLPQLENVRCNSCGTEVPKNAVGYFEDHIDISKKWGFHSPYDGELHSIDLCVGCYESWVADFEIPPQVEYKLFTAYSYS